MKRIFRTFLTITMLLLGVVSLISCGDESGHSHPVEEKWSRDASSHWHACTECDQQVDFGIHTFADWVNTDGKCEQTSECTVCGFKKTKTIEHTYENGKCSVCGEKEVVIAVGTPTKITEPMAVYVKAPADWNKVNCYYWTDPKQGDQSVDGEIEFSEQVGMWPGLSMTLVDEANNIYGFKIPAYTNMIIFNNNGNPQTIDIQLVGSNYYELTETAVTDGKFNVSKYDNYTDESGLTLAQYPSTDVVVEYEYTTIYAQLPATWTKAQVCFWDTTEGTWPEYTDLEVVDAEKHIYSIKLPTLVRSLILSGGEDLVTAKLDIDADYNIFIVTDKDTVSYGSYDATTKAITPKA